MAKRARKRRTAKRKNASKKTALGLLIIASIFVFLGAAFFFQQTSKSARERDSYGCLAAAIPEHLVVVFDKSDALNSVQKKSIRNYFEEIVALGKVNTLYSLYAIDANASQPAKQLLKRCKPKTSDEVNVLTENERLIEIEWQRGFVAPLTETLNALLEDNPSKTSPIMESLQTIALELESNHPANTRLRFIIISDMIQNVPSFSQYRNEWSFDSLRSSQYFQKIRSDFKGADIEILYVGRSGRETIQTTRHGMFWESYFNEMNGNLLSIERIIGE